jgi:quercetin dioxygenase-like cupin family protein
MKVFDLSQIKAFPYEKREKNVLFQTEEFKTRIIELPPGGKMPPCKMSEYVVFIVLEGEVTIDVNSEKKNFKEKHCLITEPATLSMQTQKGVRILGLQITATPASAS